MKLLIADDEPDVRMGLKTIIDWHGLGFDHCDEAANGDECLEKILHQNPDLVLLDIRMPKMHGLECAKAAREKGWHGKIIILSGYSDFQYAQSAIRCGVETYLLKPIDEDELEDAVQKIREKIERERKQSCQMDFALEKARSTVLLDILNGKAALDEKRVNVESLGLAADSYLVVIPEDWDTAPYGVESQELAHLLHSDSVETIKIHKIEVFLLKGSKTIQQFDSIAEEGKLTATSFSVGKIVQSIAEISQSFQGAMNIYSRRFFFARNQSVVRTKDLPLKLKSSTGCKIDVHDAVEKLYACIQACNYDAACKLLDTLYEKLIATDIQQDYAVNLLISLEIQVKNSACEDYKKDNLKVENDAEIIAGISEKKRLYEIIDMMKASFRKLIDGISNLNSNNTVDRIRIYIEKNYDKNLKLELLAQSFGYNSAYLGKMFKSHAGESFNSYLDRIRIEKAKKLLSQKDLKVYEISNRVGYENIDYFYIKFHKYVGVSPSEYRKSVQESL